MSEPRVEVVVTGVANLASVIAGLRRAGTAPRPCEDPETIRDAERVLLPGVGTFGAAMQRLRERGIDEALRQRAAADRPTLAICVGLQVLCTASEESPGSAGLGIVDATVTRFPPGVVVPQLGWNRVAPGAGVRLIPAGHAYFANSYRIATPPAGWAVATAEHGGPFVAAIERGAWTACQFHPELSASLGAAVLRRFAGGEPC